MPAANFKNTLSADLQIKGQIKFKSELFIDGNVEGEIISPGTLTVGENGQIQGEIKVRSVTVYGRVKANVEVEDRCELKGGAELLGDLKAARLVIEEGTTFVGNSEVTPNRPSMKAPEIVRGSEAGKQAASRAS